MTTATRMVIKSALEIADLIAGFILVHADLIIKKNCCECQIIDFILYIVSN